MGYPVNNSADNLFFNPGWNELDGYYAVRREEDPTRNMINMVIALEPPPEAPEEVLVAQVPVREETLPESPEEEVESVIEPEETDKIHEALNSGLEADAETEPAIPDMPPVSLAGSTSLQTTVPFEHNAYELSLAAMLEVEKVADLLQRYPEARVKLTGRADETGSADYNLLLSHQRVDQIAAYLSMRGVEDQRMETEAKGETDPVALNRYPDGSDAPLGRYLNRQVSIHISNKEAMQGDLSGFFVPPSLRVGPVDEASGQAAPQESYWFTIQVFSSLVPISVDEFGTLTGVEERACRDGYYRYVSGEYRDFAEARRVLEDVKAAGYPDAFIQTLEWFQRATR
jgi:outer membrane protein OmpA-like peptidoglycan-associated protein